MRDDKSAILRHYFGYDSFRPGQEEMIDTILSGRDVLGIMPTGGGKSMCYQIPALLMPGITLVISPLISLMKDQVTSLRESGVDAVFVNSSLTTEEYTAAVQQVARGNVKLLYVAPERLDSAWFSSFLGGQEISMVAVDEAHCVSHWGHDFRPSYLRIARFVDQLPHRPVMTAFTATATDAVRQDIVRFLKLKDPMVTVTGFDRPNLYFEVLAPESKMRELELLVRERAGQSGIVYCSTRNNVEEVCEHLQRMGFRATRYHAGLPEEERRQNQEDFQYDRCTIMVATNAFGMGIDKSNVNFVIHYNMPMSLEAYYQEAGRAGRSGEPADCILLYGGRDVQTARFLIEQNSAADPAEAEQLLALNMQQLNEMIRYCKTTRCLRAHILRYFGQEAPDQCGNCSNCRTEFRKTDITVHAQMILSCTRRVYAHLNYYLGTKAIIQILRGSRGKRLVELGLDRISTYGIMRDVSEQQVKDYIDFLTEEGYLFVEPEHKTLRPAAKAGDVLFHNKKVIMPLREEQSVEARPRFVLQSTVREKLVERLRQVRDEIAAERHLPVYIVLDGRTLEEMARKLPRTLEQFRQLSGVGDYRTQKFGQRFLDVIEQYIAEEGDGL